MRPEEHEYAAFYAAYVAKTTTEDPIEALFEGRQLTLNLLASIPFEKEQFAYDEGKWTVNQLIAHLIDSERVFQYRALRFAREEHAVCAGFEEDDWANANTARLRLLSSLITEYSHVRNSTLSLFRSFSAADFLKIGEASGHPMSVRALGFVIAGHELHHLQILKERYLAK